MYLSLLLTVISSAYLLWNLLHVAAVLITRGSKEARSVLVTQEPYLVFYSASLLSRSHSTGVAMFERAFGWVMQTSNIHKCFLILPVQLCCNIVQPSPLADFAPLGCSSSLVDTRQRVLEMIIRLLQTWLFSNIVVVGDILYLNLSLYSNKCDNIIQGMQIQGLIYN